MRPGNKAEDGADLDEDENSEDVEPGDTAAEEMSLTRGAVSV